MSMLRSFRSGFASLGEGLASIFEGMASIMGAGTNYSSSSSYQKFTNPSGSATTTSRSFTFTRNGETVHLTDAELDDETRKMMDEAIATFDEDMDTIFKDFDRTMDGLFKGVDTSIDGLMKNASAAAKRAGDATERATNAARNAAAKGN
jgi:hypothetical protein